MNQLSDSDSQMIDVVSVNLKKQNGLHKTPVDSIYLVEGKGVEGDAHFGSKVQHLFLKKKDPQQPNLRQVHLIPLELIEMLQSKGFSIGPGTLGENITTRGVDLISLPLKTRLRIGQAVIEITGLRNPCIQLDQYQAGLTKAVLSRDAQGRLLRLTGVMGIVLNSGDVTGGQEIQLDLPTQPWTELEPV